MQLNIEISDKTPAWVAADALRAWLHRVRFAHWAHFLALPLASVDLHNRGSADVLAAARGVAIAFVVLAFGYLLNSVSDRRMDLDVRKNPFIVPGAGEHRYSLATLFAIGVLLALLSPWPAQLAALSSLAFGSMYSMGPRIKSIGFLGTAANVGNFAPLLFVGMSTPSLPPHFASLSLAFASLLLQNQLIHEASDAAEDRGGGVQTTWLTLGRRRSAALAALLGGCAAVAATWVGPPMHSVAMLVGGGCAFGGLFPLLLARRGGETHQAGRLRIAHRWCALLFGAALYTASRWPI